MEEQLVHGKDYAAYMDEDRAVRDHITRLSHAGLSDIRLQGRP